jgi:hypothetical protein
MRTFNLGNGYVLGENGTITSAFRSEKAILPFIKDGSYKIIFNGKCRELDLMLAESFIKNKYYRSRVKHIDGNLLNNSLDNLEWVSSFNVHIPIAKRRAKSQSFRRIPAYPKYSANIYGDILRNDINQICKTTQEAGFKYINVTKGRTSVSKRVDKLVAMTFLLDTKKKREVHHIDGNNLNNYADNLFRSNYKHMDNVQFRGIEYSSEYGKWRSYISVEGRDLTVGYYHNRLLAATARDQALMFYRDGNVHGNVYGNGEAELNFPELGLLSLPKIPISNLFPFTFSFPSSHG